MSKAPSKARKGEGKTSLARNKAAQKPVEDSTIKATFYLTKDTVNDLEDAWMKLRRLADGSRGAITKSLIVRLALEIALEDMTSKGTASQLAKRLEQRD
ncbi:MAG TPA: hypothetical protein VFH43_00015 [Candidatus Kapabacteria bacterium]|nr:hypothetical protein [Candidatus Kapabacteria bacterium]